MKELILKNLKERLEKLHKEEDKVTKDELGSNYIDSLIAIYQEEDAILDKIYLYSSRKF